MTDFVLNLADNALILGHRNSEWTGHGPILEQDIALSNIALDLIGQSRHFYQHAAELLGGGATEDSLAYLRNPEDFKNCLLVEQPNGHWGTTIMRQFLFSAYQHLVYSEIANGSDNRLSAIAIKSLKETTYHLRWSSEWVIRLGQGTDVSHEKMQDASNVLWPFTEDLLAAPSYDPFATKWEAIRSAWQQKVNEIYSAASLEIPSVAQTRIGGREGQHTVHLQELLKEMQYLQRTYPGVEW